MTYEQQMQQAVNLVNRAAYIKELHAMREREAQRLEDEHALYSATSFLETLGVLFVGIIAIATLMLWML